MNFYFCKALAIKHTSLCVQHVSEEFRRLTSIISNCCFLKVFTKAAKWKQNNIVSGWFVIGDYVFVEIKLLIIINKLYFLFTFVSPCISGILQGACIVVFTLCFSFLSESFSFSFLMLFNYRDCTRASCVFLGGADGLDMKMEDDWTHIRWNPHANEEKWIESESTCWYYLQKNMTLNFQSYKILKYK